MLQPALMGLFSEIMLIFDYARYSHLGIVDSLDKELPVSYGKKDHQRMEMLKDIGFSICLIVSLCIATALLLVSLFMDIAESRLLVIGIRIVSIMVVVRTITSLYIVLNRSRNRFSIISRYTILAAIADIALKIFLISRYGLLGLLWATLLTLIIGLAYFYKASGKHFKLILKFPLKEAAGLFKVGFPIFIMGFVLMTLRNLDRIMIIRLLDLEQLGFYTIALMVSVYIVQLPNLIYAVFFPRFYQVYGEKQNISDIKEFFIKPTLVFAYFFPVLIGLVILALPLLVHYVLPAYTAGLTPAYLLLLGSSFLALINMPGYLLIVLNKQIYMVLIGAACIFAGAGLIYLFVSGMNMGLCGIAIGTSLTYFLYSTVIMAYAYRNYTPKLLSHLRFFTQLYLPFFWVVLLMLILQTFAFQASGNITKDLLAAGFKGMVFLICCTPLVLYADKQTSILALVKDNIFSKRKKLGAL